MLTKNRLNICYLYWLIYIPSILTNEIVLTKSWQFVTASCVVGTQSIIQTYYSLRIRNTLKGLRFCIEMFLSDILIKIVLHDVEILLLWESNLNFFYPLKHVNHISWLVSTGKCSLSQMSYKIDGLKKFTKLSLFKKRYRDTSFPVIFQAYLFNRTSSDDCFCSNASYCLMETYTSSWNIFDKVSYFTVVKQLRDFTSDLVRILELFTVAAAGGVLWKKLFLKLTGKHLCEGWRPPTIFKEDSSKVFFLWTLRNF